MEERNRDIIYSIFKRASINYYNSSRFFRKSQRDDIAVLYAFVRYADDFVDSKQQKAYELKIFKKAFFDYPNFELKRDPIAKIVIDEFFKLSKKMNFKLDWIDSFFSAMESDLLVRDFKTSEELYKYMYGSAVVIGYMIAKIFDLPSEATKYSESLSNAMQLGNFIRDIGIDLDLGRVYIPREIFSKYGFETLNRDTIQNEKKQFELLIKDLSKIYFELMQEGKKGFKYLPFWSRVAVRTSAEMYDFSVRCVIANPQIVLKKACKPSKYRVILFGIKNIVLSLF